MHPSQIKFKDSIAYTLIQVEKKYANRNAIAIGNKKITYYELFSLAKRIALQLMRSKSERCLILSLRNNFAYVGLLGSLLAGKAYVFLNTKESISQLSETILLSQTDLLIYDDFHSSVVFELGRQLPNQLTLVNLNHQGKLMSGGDIYIPPKEVYHYAYMMFTSGSTGKPKGVPISHKNLKTFISNICDRVKPTPDDRFSHVNELTFDFSIYEIFCCWFSGACLCVLPDHYFYGVDKYIKQHQITCWASVPSVIQILNQLKKLNGANFHSIRYSTFCGEALTGEIASQWKLAAPHTKIDNLYGPTEATVAITGYLWNENNSDEVVPIGHPFPGQGFYLVSESYEIVEVGDIGEIYLYGNQVAQEYWNSNKITQSCFMIFNGKLVYKTGDLAYFDKNKGLIFKGRKDDQLKISGYRIEKIEIENRIKSILQTQAVAIVAIKDKMTGQVSELICFFSKNDCSVESVKILCRKLLPPYMIPNIYIYINELPYNKNGKVDYQVLKHYRKIAEKG